MKNESTRLFYSIVLSIILLIEPISHDLYLHLFRMDGLRIILYNDTPNDVANLDDYNGIKKDCFNQPEFCYYVTVIEKNKR